MKTYWGLHRGNMAGIMRDWTSWIGLNWTACVHGVVNFK